MLFYEADSGKFIDREIQDKELFIIGVYGLNEDWTDLDGQIPYVYESIKELKTALKKDTDELINYIVDSNTVLVIRKINCKVLSGA